MKVAKKLYVNNHSGYKCIHWDKINHKWIVKVIYNFKRLYLGAFKDIDDAVRARNSYGAVSSIFRDIGVADVYIKIRESKKQTLCGSIPKNGLILSISIEPVAGGE